MPTVTKENTHTYRMSYRPSRESGEVEDVIYYIAEELLLKSTNPTHIRTHSSVTPYFTHYDNQRKQYQPNSLLNYIYDSGAPIIPCTSSTIDTSTCKTTATDSTLHSLVRTIHECFHQSNNMRINPNSKSTALYDPANLSILLRSAVNTNQALQIQLFMW